MPAKKKQPTMEERLRRCEEEVRSAGKAVELLRMAQVAVRRDFDGLRGILSQVTRLKADVDAVWSKVALIKSRCMPEEGALRISKSACCNRYELRRWRDDCWEPVGCGLTCTRWGMKRLIKRELGRAGLKRLVR